MKKIVILLACILGIAGISLAQDFKIIVNSANGAAAITKKDATDIFLKKKSKWPTGEKAVAVDLGSSSAVRESFSSTVLGKSTSQVRAFWQQSVFAGGETPPQEVKTDAEVVEFVKSNPGAIGYVSSGASTAGVKTLAVQ